ncbi:MAG: CHRD domain-containing protein [Euryarchaeota archaeon]|nr:CHRD domain-containing protein [Euryarchaeota archaeon]
MHTHDVIVITLALVIAFAAGATTAGATNGDDVHLVAELTGEAEAPEDGDPDGSGEAEIKIRSDWSGLCWRIEVSDIEPATAAHIHEAPEGEAGPVVVPLSAPTNGTSDGCTQEQNETLYQRIAENPADFYVNVHNVLYPGGAVRGQLEDKDEMGDILPEGNEDGGDDNETGDDADAPAPAAVLFVATIAAAIFALRRRP